MEFDSKLRKVVKCAFWRARHGKKSGSEWCNVCVPGKSANYAGSRLGSKLMNRCKPENKDTKEHGNMLKILLKLKEGSWTGTLEDGA